MPVFQAQLTAYKRSVDEDIAVYAAHIQKSAKLQYGTRGEEVTKLFIAELMGSAERIPGILAIACYEMLGGKDHQMIVRAATALEMMHAYTSILENVHRDKLQTDPDLLEAGIMGMHAAQMLFSGLSVSPELKVKVLGIVNLAMVVAGHGRIADQHNPLQVIEWKTANHLTLNPACVGMVLASAGCQDTDAIRTYALQLGAAIVVPVPDRESYTRYAVEALGSAPAHWNTSHVAFLKDFALQYAG